LRVALVGSYNITPARDTLPKRNHGWRKKQEKEEEPRITRITPIRKKRKDRREGILGALPPSDLPSPLLFSSVSSV
jgi:hypothetical protein